MSIIRRIKSWLHRRREPIHDEIEPAFTDALWSGLIQPIIDADRPLWMGAGPVLLKARQAYSRGENYAGLASFEAYVRLKFGHSLSWARDVIKAHEIACALEATGILEMREFGWVDPRYGNRPITRAYLTRNWHLVGGRDG